MTKDEINKLSDGDIVRNVRSGNSYIVVCNDGDGNRPSNSRGQQPIRVGVVP